MPFIVVLLTLLGLSLAAPQGDEDTQLMVVPVYAPEIQTKIIELYELLKAELEEGDEITNVIEPMEPQINEISRKKRSAEASPFFFGRLFGFGRRRYGGYGGYGRRRSYGHGYNRGYRRSYGRRYYH